MSSQFDPERVISLQVPDEALSFNVATFDFSTLETLPGPLPPYPGGGLTHHEVEIYSVGPDGPEVRKIISSGSLLDRIRHQLTKPGGMVEVDDADGWHVYIPVNTITQVRIREL